MAAAVEAAAAVDCLEGEVGTAEEEATAAAVGLAGRGCCDVAAADFPFDGESDAAPPFFSEPALVSAAFAPLPRDLEPAGATVISVLSGTHFFSPACRAERQFPDRRSERLFDMRNHPPFFFFCCCCAPDALDALGLLS